MNVVKISLALFHFGILKIVDFDEKLYVKVDVFDDFLLLSLY